MAIAGVLGLAASAAAQEAHDPPDPRDPSLCWWSPSWIGAARQAEPETPTRGRPRFRWDDHPSLRLGRGTRIDFRARLQTHVRHADVLPDDAPSFEVTRRRIGVDGRILGAVDFQVERELVEEDPWRDVYAEYRQFGAVRVRGGKFKLPFSLDENTSPTNLDFVYRSRAADELAPGRDRGVMVHGRVVRVVRYELGWFDHDGRNARTGNPDRVFGDRTTAARVALQPFRGRRSVLEDLQVAGAWTESEVREGFPALRGRTAFSETFHRSDTWVKGPRRRTGFEVRWRPGPFSLKAEHISVSTAREGQSVEGTDLSALVAEGWYVSGTWVVTGDRKVDGLHRPRRPLFRGGLGAIELAARLEEVTFRSAARNEPPSSSARANVIVGSRDRVTTLGVNWHPWRGVKLQFNLIREAITAMDAVAVPAGPPSWGRVLRLQLAI